MNKKLYEAINTYLLAHGNNVPNLVSEIREQGLTFYITGFCQPYVNKFYSGYKALVNGYLTTRFLELGPENYQHNLIEYVFGLINPDYYVGMTAYEVYCIKHKIAELFYNQHVYVGSGDYDDIIEFINMSLLYEFAREYQG